MAGARIRRAGALVASTVFFACGCALAQNQNKAEAPTPEVRVEYFGAEKGYAVRGEAVTLLCVVRNIGTGPLPDHAVRLHCFTVDGLDYTSGDTMPVLPAMARNQAIAYRWRLMPTEDGSPLVAAVVVESPTPVFVEDAAKGPAAGRFVPVPAPPPVGDNPRALVAVIPRMSAPPGIGSRVIPANALPTATAGSDEAWLSNDRVGLHLLMADRRRAVLVLCGRVGTEWQAFAMGPSLAEVRSAEEGQVPWSEGFRWRESSARASKDSASVTLVGSVGSRWRAEMTFEIPPWTGSIRCTLHLTALRDLRLYGVRLPFLIADAKSAQAPRADGSALPLAADEPILPDEARVAAWHLNGVTFGVTWPGDAPFPGGKWQVDPIGDSANAPIIGAEWGEDRGEAVPTGETINIPFRLFAVSPSDTVHDALRFQIP